VLLLHSIISAQEDKDFPAIGINDVAGGSINKTNYFDGSALWGHIDGGADLYLEYGFDRLLFQEIKWNDVNFRVEYYRMKNAEAAFGIYSVSRFKCAKTDTITKFICVNPYQIQSALGRFYISIANDKGNKAAVDLSMELFNKILEKNRDKIFDLPSQFNKPVYAKYISQLKMMNGVLGIQNGFPNWEELFNGFSGYTLFILPIENKNTYVTISQVEFSVHNDIVKFLEKNNIKIEPGKQSYQASEKSVFRKFTIVNENKIIFYETNDFAALRDYID
jgi:hypothetical protein